MSNELNVFENILKLQKTINSVPHPRRNIPIKCEKCGKEFKPKKRQTFTNSKAIKDGNLKLNIFSLPICPHCNQVQMFDDIKCTL